MDGAARRLRVSPGRTAADGTMDFVPACVPPQASVQCHVHGADCQAVVRRGSIAVRAGWAACIHTAGRDHGHEVYALTAVDLLRAVDLAAVNPAAAEDIAVISAGQVTNTL